MVTAEAAFLALLALAVEGLRWAFAIGAFLLVLYWLVRFVKWAWSDDPSPVRTQPTDAEQGLAKAMTLLEPGSPLSAEQWGTVLDGVTGHTSDGRPICQKCGFEPAPVL